MMSSMSRRWRRLDKLLLINLCSINIPSQARLRLLEFAAAHKLHRITPVQQVPAILGQPAYGMIDAALAEI